MIDSKIRESSVKISFMSTLVYAERARIETPWDFKSMHSRMMTWQSTIQVMHPQHLQKGRDVSENTQVELVLLEHSCDQVELKAILSFCCYLLFSTFWL